MKKLTDIQKAYIAGFIDGEGCITVCRRMKPSGNYSYQVRVIITNTDLKIIRWFKKVTGIGFVRTATWENYSEKWKPIHRYEVDSNLARELLDEISPYLMIKKDVARLVRDFPTRKGGMRRSSQEYKEQVKAFAGIAALNRRGIGPAFLEA